MPQKTSSQPQQSGTNFKEAFQLFDKRGNGLVALDQLGDLLRACGQNPTLAEIAELEKSVGNDCESTLLQRVSVQPATESEAEVEKRRERRLICYALDVVDYETFSRVLNRKDGFRDHGLPEEYCRGFQVFDKDMTGFIGVGQLRYSMLLPALHSLLRVIRRIACVLEPAS